jgi:DNA-binding FadR family transcriptional regulator
MNHPTQLSDFLNYLIDTDHDIPNDPGNDSLPSINEISSELGISVSSVREQLEVAKALGLVEVRPRTGIRRLPYSFTPAVNQSLTYAISMNKKVFEIYSDLRIHIETSYWDQAVTLLTEGDRAELRKLVDRAWEKLRGTPIQIPHSEHRQFHLKIYSRLENVFVQGILEAYWDAYEAVGLDVYADYQYLQEVWKYHQIMIDSINSGDIHAGYQALTEHKDLLYHRPGQSDS